MHGVNWRSGRACWALPDTARLSGGLFVVICVVVKTVGTRMINLDRSESLFSTPLLRFSVNDHAALDAALLAEGARMRALDGGVAKSNKGGWHSQGNLLSSDAACIVTLRKAVEQAIVAANRKVKATVDPDILRLKLFGWMNINPPGGFNAPHTHPGAHWSGVYYVAQPAVEDGTSGMIEFLDPRSDLPNWRILGARAFRPKRRFRPQPGEIVIFPSYLVHWVYPNDTPEERVTIAFNATFKKARDAAD